MHVCTLISIPFNLINNRLLFYTCFLFSLLFLSAVSNPPSPTPVVLVLMNAGPLDISWGKDSPYVNAILECFFPAQATGEAIRRVLFNDGPYSNPAGRLPATWPMSIDQVSLGQ